MPLPWDQPLSGRLDRHVLHSVALEGNRLDDPADRPVLVYTPPGYETSKDSYPVVYVLQGYGAHLGMWANRSAYRPTYAGAIDQLFLSGGCPPCLVVFVDAWTAYGGSQFVDSPGTGRYHTYLCEDVVAFVDAHYRTLASAGHRGVQGMSSGGFGAMITPMLRPDVFGGMAAHAGDALYELLYIPEFAKAARALREYDGSIRRWWDDFNSRVAFTKGADHMLLLLLGVSACFSPDENGEAVLPFDPTTGRPRDDVWQRWLEWDPVRMVTRHADALRGLKATWVDAGRSDEFYLDLAARAFVDELDAVGVTDVHFELFDGGHRAIDYRYPLSLAFLAERLA